MNKERTMRAHSCPKFCATFVFLSGIAGTMVSAETVHFDNVPWGKLPTNWVSAQTGPGQPEWAVAADATAPSKPHVLKQSGEATYSLCIKQDARIRDGFVEVKFKAISGKEGQTGGILWRCQDSNNYYVARANALENNLTIYQMVKGRRTEKRRTDLAVPANVWHTLRVDYHDTHFVIRFDGKVAFTWDDGTFKEAGKIGLWTQADSVTLFDDFSYGEE